MNDIGITQEDIYVLIAIAVLFAVYFGLLGKRECFACGGTGVFSEGKACPRCGGRGWQ